jgi:hypothetical protein
LELLLKNLDPELSGALERALSGKAIDEDEALRLLDSSYEEALILALVADQARKASVGRCGHLRGQQEYKLHKRVYRKVPLLRLLEAFRLP